MGHERKHAGGVYLANVTYEDTSSVESILGLNYGPMITFPEYRGCPQMKQWALTGGVPKRSAKARNVRICSSCGNVLATRFDHMVPVPRSIY